MSLSANELNTLMNILEENDSGEYTFETVAGNFHCSFKKSDYFRVGSALVLLLQNEDLLPTKEQRFLSIFLLYEMYRTEPIQGNPFASVFVHLLHPPDDIKSESSGKPTRKPWSLPHLSNPEKYFLAQLISVPDKDLLKNTLNQVFQLDVSDKQSFDVSGLQLALAECHSEMSYSSKSGIPVVLPYPDEDVLKEEVDQDVLKRTREALLCGNDAPLLSCYKPECIRLVPPLHAFDDELVWMNLSFPSKHKIAWDTSMCASKTSAVESKRLMTDALKSTLTLAQQQQLLSELAADTNLVHNVGLTPEKFPDLVEHNPAIAHEVLLRLIPNRKIVDYFQELVNMQLSLHSMEVVNRLTQTVALPTEFVQLYISNCILSCEIIKEKNSQTRLVRLVCAFLQSLIRNKVIKVQDLSIETQSFCIEFSHIREASTLFQLLKQVYNEEKAPGQTVPNGQSS